MTEILLDFASPLNWRGVLAAQFSALALAALAGLFYLTFSRILPDREKFIWSLIPLAMVSALLAGIIGSSVALSLGFVGAISVIRFRTRMQEIMRTLIVFLVMSGGLGIGMGKGMQVWLLTLLVFFTWMIQIFIERREGKTFFLDTQFIRLSEVINAVKAVTPWYVIEEWEARPDNDRAKLRLQVKGDVQISELAQKLREFSGIQFKLAEEVDDEE